MIIIGGVAHFTTPLDPSILKESVGPHELGHNTGLENTKEDSQKPSLMRPHQIDGVQEIDRQTFDIHHDEGRPAENEEMDLNRLETTKVPSI